MPSGLIATPHHESHTSRNVRGMPLAEPSARLAKCGNPQCGQSVSLRLEINHDTAGPSTTATARHQGRLRAKPPACPIGPGEDK